MARPKPTIYDIAALCAASPSTVSAVLSGAWRERRISQATAERIQGVASAQGYSANLQARGLRRARSGLVGMILPTHDNRFFAAMSQSFEAQARVRGLCPVVVSTLRDPEEEARTVETLLSYAVDALFVAGAADPGAVGALCRAAETAHVFLDLPGPDAPSVVSDNYRGAEALTRALLGQGAGAEPGGAGGRGGPAGVAGVVRRRAEGARGRPYFFGGAPGDFATRRRIAAFRAVAGEVRGPVADEQIVACGYAPARACREIAALVERLGGLPAALFINALTVFEGVMSHFVTLPDEAFAGSAIGCYDYDPFASFLRFPVHMIRQNAGGLIEGAFALIDAGEREPVVVEVAPELVAPRTIRPGPFGDIG